MQGLGITVDDNKSCITLRTLNYGNYGIFLIITLLIIIIIMDNAGFISSTVWLPGFQLASWRLGL